MNKENQINNNPEGTHCILMGCTSVIPWSNPNNPRRRSYTCKNCNARIIPNAGVREATERGSLVIPQLANKMVRRARYRKKYEVTVTPRDVCAVWPASSRCPILDIPFEVAQSNTGDRTASPSLDRIDPARGYHPDNIRVISTLANRMLQDASPELLERLALWILSNNSMRSTTD